MLDKLTSPRVLKEFTPDELKFLTDEIRALIITVVSQKGGHLASSLGAVELCIALHYVLDTPFDTLIFDVGHQAYAHKIITGRKDIFSSLRQYQGMSGFPHFQESVYDPYWSGHASTAVSWALGIAEAKRLRSDNSRTVAVIGDGSLSGGMCFEALNHCGHSGSDVFIVVNHNEMSISPSVGALSNYLTKIISAPIYNRIKNELESFISNFSLAKKIARHGRKFEEAIKGLIIPGIFFEELGFRYFGPVDGHNLEVLIPTFKNVLALKGPRILHVLTTKGKGCLFSELNPEEFHSASPFDPLRGTFVQEKKETFSDVFGKKLVSLAREESRIVTITAAMPKGTGLTSFAEQFPDRFFDVGIAEEHAVGFASGLAKQGLVPVVAIYSTFLQRAFDQLIHDVALQDVGVVFCLDRAGIVGGDGPTHHGLFDIPYLRLIPHMVCMAPKDKEEFEDMLTYAVKVGKPTSIRYPKGETYSLGKGEEITLGKAEVLCEGSDLCIIALGSMVKTALQCRALLNEKGISVFLVNARFIKPLDEDLLKYLAHNFKIIMTVEESTVVGGFGSAVLELLERESLLGTTELMRAGLPDEFIPHGQREILLKLHGLDPASLAERVMKRLQQPQSIHPSFSQNFRS